jgi:hypothetical protein
MPYGVGRKIRISSTSRGWTDQKNKTVCWRWWKRSYALPTDPEWVRDELLVGGGRRWPHHRFQTESSVRSVTTFVEAFILGRATTIHKSKRR